MRIGHLDEKNKDEKNFNSTYEKDKPNNNPMQSSTVSLTISEAGGDISWPDVVRALDKLFFGVFLICYFIITVSLIGTAVNE